MIYLLYISNLMRAYYMIRAAHGVYVSFIFLQWLITNIYSGLVWVFYCIPKPSLQIKDKEKYYIIDNGEYVNIIEKD